MPAKLRQDYTFIPLKDKIYQYNVLAVSKSRSDLRYLQDFIALLEDALAQAGV